MITEKLSAEAVKALASPSDDDRAGFGGEPLNRATCIAF